MTQAPENPSGPPMYDEVHIIGGNRYRTGFLNASWGSFDREDPRVLIRARRQNVLTMSQNLFHYTSLAGLKGIIDENGFWASDNRFMNDAEESVNGIKLTQKILRHRAMRTRNAGFENIIQKVDELLASPRQHGHLVACFSTVRDDLGQWRGYGAGGVCICLGKVDGQAAPLFFGPDHLPYKAIYNDVRKCVLLLSILKDFEREYALDRELMHPYWPDDHDENYVKELHSKLSGCILGFKDSAFQNEAEARIVLSYERADRYEGGLRFRVGSLGIIPFLRTGDHVAVKQNPGPLPLREIIVGPGPHQELIAQSVETFLKQRGYDKTSVSLSKVPYRTP
jgi:hypothetical protein